MTEHSLLAIASIIVFGIGAQWLAWRFKLPSILVLLLFGFVAGPVTGFLHPDELLGDLLFPIVSASVALILFEGGLSLKFSELRQTGHIVRNLITIGALSTWAMSAAAAYFILNFQLPIALLFGAILVVTGPTVIIPLLRHVRVADKLGSVIKWEGIVNDPIGAILAVLVFEAVVASGVQESTLTVVIGILETVLIATVLGGACTWGLTQLLKRYWIPGYLQNSFTLMVVLAAFAVSNAIQAESGLFTVTLMGMLLANQNSVSIKHIIEFKENLGVVLLSGLFIILAARVELADLVHLGWGSLLFLAVLIIVVRPISVLLSTIRSGLSWKDKAFLAWMAPRGIVAAAVTAVFALELAEEAGYAQAELMVPEMFAIIVVTVTIYGLSAAPLGRWLKVAQPDPQGVLIAGAHPWARAMARALQAEGFQVLLVDKNRENIKAARLEGLETVYASILSEYLIDEIEFGSIGRLLAMTPNDEVNSLAALHLAEAFDRAELYQLTPKEPADGRKESISKPLRGRLLFSDNTNYINLSRRFAEGQVIKTTPLTKQFDYQAFQQLHNGRALPLFLITSAGALSIFTTEQELAPQPGDLLISLVEPTETDHSAKGTTPMPTKQKTGVLP